MLKRAAASAAVILALSLSAAAQEGVRLKSGKFVAGAVAIDEHDPEGFKVQRWDTGGVVYIRWNQIPEMEKTRLLGKSPEAGPAVDLLDGIRVLTNSREVTGLLVKEEATQIHIKTKDSKNPLPVPKTALLHRENLKVKESDVYSPDEMIDLRGAKAKDFAALMEVGRFAAGLKMYERAKEFYQKALAADASKKEELEPILAAMDVRIKESKAQAWLAKIKEMVENADYEKAIEEAKKFVAESADTETGKQNADLEKRLAKEAEDFKLHKAKILADKVPGLYRTLRTNLIATYAGGKYKLDEARGLAQKLDDEILNQLAKQFKGTPEEIDQAWAKRDPQPRKVTYGSGAWIAKGGKDGGLDFDGKLDKNNRNGNGNNEAIDDYLRRFGRQGGGGAPAKPQDLGKKLQSKDEWWQSASSIDRKYWLETEYVNTSSRVKKVEEKPRKCPTCHGEGMMKAVRYGVPVDATCPRCHGVKEEIEYILYW